jgi:hypothetical protein
LPAIADLRHLFAISILSITLMLLLTVCLPLQVFFYLFFINNLFITSTLIVGASSVITTLTGVSVEASCMLIPLGIIIYCVAGGLKVIPAQ